MPARERPVHRRAFGLFCSLPPPRALKDLARHPDNTYPLPTLRRWAALYRWLERAQRHDRGEPSSFADVTRVPAPAARANRLRAIAVLLQENGLLAPDPSPDTATARLEQRKIRFLDKFLRTNGDVNAACRAASICRSTFYAWRDNDPDFRKIVDEVRVSVTEAVENALVKNALAGDVRAQIFYLQCRKGHAWNPNKHAVPELPPGTTIRTATVIERSPNADDDTETLDLVEFLAQIGVTKLSRPAALLDPPPSSPPSHDPPHEPVHPAPNVDPPEGLPPSR